MADKKQPRRSADSYGSPSNSSTIKTKSSSSTIKNINKPTSRELASLKKAYAKTPKGMTKPTPRGMTRPPRTGPGSGGGVRSLYNRLTGGGLNKHGR